MGNSDSRSVPQKRASNDAQFSFFSVVTIAGGTLVGGYLILNALGRPTEFHCTESIKPTRAQEILYGPTLAPFLYAEQLGRSLIAAAKGESQILFTDSEPALDLRRIVDLPVMHVVGSDCKDNEKTIEFGLGANKLRVMAETPNDQHAATERWRDHIAEWDLLEPFRRIHDAIAETHKAA